MTDPLTTAIVAAIAESKGVDPVDLEFTLGEYVDPDAIEQLAAHQNESWTLSFELPDQGITIEVTGDRDIRVNGTRVRKYG